MGSPGSGYRRPIKLIVFPLVAIAFVDYLKGILIDVQATCRFFSWTNAWRNDGLPILGKSPRDWTLTFQPENDFIFVEAAVFCHT
jgi:hypothetical protein